MNNRMLTLGSLFSGSGGFELAGILTGITPVWNSEFEPFPILVTQKRLPRVQHYGDILARIVYYEQYQNGDSGGFYPETEQK